MFKFIVKLYKIRRAAIQARKRQERQNKLFQEITKLKSSF